MASAHVAKVSRNVVKPRPSRTPYSAAAAGTGRMRRHDSGTCRRTCGTIRRPAASPIAQTTSAAIASATTGPSSVVPSQARPPKVIAPPASAPAVKVTMPPRARSSVSTMESPHGDHEPATPASSATAIRASRISTAPSSGRTSRRTPCARRSSSP